jgi:DNA-binding transcriptional LysR family regulator
MDRLREMEVFVRIVDCGSLTQAAESLDVSLPTVVRLLAGLEKRLGARLLQRTTRRLALTDEGAEFYERSKRILVDIDEAEAGSSGTVPRGLLRATAPVLFGCMHVQPLVLEFLRKYPEVSVDLLMLDRIVDLLEERIDVGVRIGHLAESSLVAHAVGEVRLVLCASPEYLARSGTPAHPRDLDKHACLRFSGFTRPVEWSFRVGGEELKVPVSGRLLVNHNAALINACVAGMGIARFLSYQVAPLVTAGRLQIVLAEFSEPPRPISVVVPSARHLPARTRLLSEWLRAELPPRLATCRI